MPLAVPLTVILRVTPRAVITQTPGTVVQPALQVQVITVVVAPPVAGKAVIQQRGGDAFIPLLRRNIAAGTVLHRHLRQTDVEAQRGKVEYRFASGNSRGERNAGIALHVAQFRERRDIDAKAIEQRACDARRQSARDWRRVVGLFKAHILRADKLIVAPDIHAIDTGCLLVPLFET